jgi:hypothetical protein
MILSGTLKKGTISPIALKPIRHSPHRSGPSCSSCRFDVRKSMPATNVGCEICVNDRVGRFLRGTRIFLPTRPLTGRGNYRFITLGRKPTGKPIAGNPHAGFDAAGIGNQFTVWLVRHSHGKRRGTDRPNLRSLGASPRPCRPSCCMHARFSSPLLCRFETANRPNSRKKRES